jgi:hypothetical protein
MQRAHGTNAGSAADANHLPAPAAAPGITFDDLGAEFGDRWVITRITAGYRAVIRAAGGHTPIPRYGRTPGELAESIRCVERQP